MDGWGNTVDYTDVQTIRYVVTILQVRRLFRVGGYMLQMSQDWKRPNNAGRTWAKSWKVTRCERSR